jgi:hypothetical protein
LRAKLEAVEGDDDGGNPFITAHPEFKGVSVKVVGVFTDANGTVHAFTFTSDVEAELAMDFATPVTVGATTTNLTIDVNVGSWFKDASGAVIDPTKAENQRAIEQAIRASLSAFEDDDHDGDDDHAPEGAGGGTKPPSRLKRRAKWLAVFFRYRLNQYDSFTRNRLSGRKLNRSFRSPPKLRVPSVPVDPWRP